MDFAIVVRIIYANTIMEILNTFGATYEFTYPDYFGPDQITVFAVKNLTGINTTELRSIIRCRMDSDDCIVMLKVSEPDKEVLEGEIDD